MKSYKVIVSLRKIRIRFTISFMNFLERESGSCLCVNNATESSQISSKISLFVYRRWTKFLQVWNDM